MDEFSLYKAIGLKIKELRKAKSISQQDLAAMCDFEKSNMSRIEAGRTNLTVKSIFKISQALGVRPKDIVDVKMD